MYISNKQNIGKAFKKENIVLATISTSTSKEKVIEILKSKMLEESYKVEKLPKEIMSALVENIKFEEYDIFYKDENGYIRFLEKGPETYIGDNSDGKGFIKNVVSIWDYYLEEALKEVMINNSFMAIVTTDMGPLNKYNKDYNLA